jgi:hypothetical protein
MNSTFEQKSTCLLTNMLAKSTRNIQGSRLDCSRHGSLAPALLYFTENNKLTKGIPAYIRDEAHTPALKEYLIRRSKEATGCDKSWDEATYESIDWRCYGEVFKKLSHRQCNQDFQVHQ